jgi:hypothetical protein
MASWAPRDADDLTVVEQRLLQAVTRGDPVDLLGMTSGH